MPSIMIYVKKEDDPEFSGHENKSEPEKIRLSLRGVIFEVKLSVFQKCPQSRLAHLTEMDYDEASETFMFKRSPYLFQNILSFYENNQLHFPESLCHEEVKEELNFWRIKPQALSRCCYSRYMQAEDLMMKRKKFSQGLNPILECMKSESSTEKQVSDEEFHDGLSFRDKAWLFFEDPYSSKYGVIWAVLLVIATTFSLASFGLNTTATFRKADEATWALYRNITENRALWLLRNTHNSSLLFYIDILCLLISTFDFSIRLILVRKKRLWLKDPLNIFHLFILVALWVFSISIGMVNFGENKRTRDILTELNLFYLGGAFRFGRIFLLVRLVKVYRPLKILLTSIANSWRELLILVWIVSNFVFVFSLLAYYAELLEGTFDTVVDAYWWALITMTTVGYGDIYPVTALGKVFGSLCALCGVLFIALPVGIVGSNFVKLYDMHRKYEWEKTIKLVECDAR